MALWPSAPRLSHTRAWSRGESPPPPPGGCMQVATPPSKTTRACSLRQARTRTRPTRKGDRLPLGSRRCLMRVRQAHWTASRLSRTRDVGVERDSRRRWPRHNRLHASVVLRHPGTHRSSLGTGGAAIRRGAPSYTGGRKRDDAHSSDDARAFFLDGGFGRHAQRSLLSGAFPRQSENQQMRCVRRPCFLHDQGR